MTSTSTAQQEDTRLSDVVSELESIMATDSDSDKGVVHVPHRVRIKNRRRRYLDLHPEYFGPQLELADPLLYDRLIRRFQTTTEREAEGRQKGYSGVLEADLFRGEAKLHALQNPDPDSEIVYTRGQHGEILAEEQDDVPVNKDAGLKRWTDVMSQRFITGRDADFDYDTVDNDDAYDDLTTEERELQETWFDRETPEWLDGSGDQGVDMELRGETGVQDF